jgi:hypothetical protein
LLLAAACGDDSGPIGGIDAGSTDDGGFDAAPFDAGPPPMRDAGCPSGTHECGTSCTPDGPNETTTGCRLGCGTACPEPAMFGMAVCTSEGRCAIECTPPAMLLDDTCVCEPLTCGARECGTPLDGCGGMLECGACGTGSTCTPEGMCVCTPDEAEPNGNRATAFRIGPFDNSRDGTTTFTAFAIEDTRDEDWFIATVTDGSDGGNPVLELELSGIPEGSNYDLSAFYVCAEGTDATSCSAGMSDAEIGRGCSSASTGTTSELIRLETDCEHLSTDDDGDLFVRIRPVDDAATCDPYTLRISVR